MSCRLCKSNELQNWEVRDAKSSEKLIMSLCLNCSLVQQAQIPSDNELKIYYSHNYREDYKSTYHPKLKHVRRAGVVALDRLSFMRQIGLTPKGQQLIDIGAGGGEFCYMANLAGFHAIGIEPHLGYSEYSRSNYNIRIDTCGIADIQNQSADIVTLFHVLEHLAHPDQVMVKIWSILRENGYLVVEVPNILQADASPSNIYFKAHLYYFSRYSLWATASKYFDLVNIEDQGNLLMVLKKRSKPLIERMDPKPEEWVKIRQRMASKGWFEYLTVGGGFFKPISRIGRIWTESRIQETTPKAVLDHLLVDLTLPISN